MGMSLYLMLFSIALLSIIVVGKTVYYRKKIDCMSGMMIAMTLGMRVGLIIGVIFGILFSGNFYIIKILLILVFLIRLFYIILTLFISIIINRSITILINLYNN